MRMTHDDAQFGNFSQIWQKSRSIFLIQSNETYLDKEIVNKKYPKEKIEEYLDYEFPDHQPYMSEAKDMILKKEMDKIKNSYKGKK